MTPPAPLSQQTMLQNQINNLSETMQAGFAEIKTLLQAIDNRVRLIETSEAGSHPLINQKLDAAWRKIDDHDQSIKTLEKNISSLQQSNRLLSWIASISGGAVILWFVNQILGLIK